MTAPALFDLTVLTHDRVVFEGRSTSIVVPGAYGYLGVMARHQPLIASLGQGILSVRDERGVPLSWSVNRGVMEVVANTVTILVEEAGEVGAVREPGA